MSNLPALKGQAGTSGRKGKQKYSLNSDVRDPVLAEKFQHKAATFTSASIANSSQMRALNEDRMRSTHPARKTTTNPQASLEHANVAGKLFAPAPLPASSTPRAAGSAGTAAGPSPTTTFGSPVSSTQYNNSKMAPSELYVSQQRSQMTEDTWRSRMLMYETDLRELTVDRAGKPPSMTALMRLLRIYDGFSRAMEEESPFVAELLRLFRIEFCKSIFVDESDDSEYRDGTTHQDSDMSDMQAYFDRVSVLEKENAALNAEVAVGNTQERIAQLNKDLEQKTEMLKMFENEIGRLTRQNEHLTTQCKRAREETEANLEKYKAERRVVERELQSLNADNKDMQLQLFRLRKQIAGGKSKLLKDNYHQTKLSKLSMMTTLFSEGDERIITLVMLSQLESRLNEILDAYDGEYSLTAESALPEAKRKLCDSSIVLLEEMHLCTSNYRRLVPSKRTAAVDADGEAVELFDETDGFVALLFDPRIYRNLMERESIKTRLMNTDINLGDEASIRVDEKAASSRLAESGFAVGEASGSTPSSGSNQQSFINQDTYFHEQSAKRLSDFRKVKPPLASAGNGKETSNSGSPKTGPLEGNGAEEHDTADKVVFLKKKEWVENIFNSEGIDAVLRKARESVEVHRQNPGKIDADVLMRRVNKTPMLDLTDKRFHSLISLYSGRDPSLLKLLCNVAHVDPTNAVQLPPATQFVKIKYVMDTEGRPGNVISHRADSHTAGEGSFLASADGGNRSGSAGLGGGHADDASFLLSSNSRNTMGTATAERERERERANSQLKEWGGKTAFQDEQITPHDRGGGMGEESLVSLNENLKVFRELGNPSQISLDKNTPNAVAAQSSTTAATVAFQRLDPLSPNRGPEWTLYKTLFNGFRSLTPRMLDVTTIDQILLKACEHHFTRMQFRFDHCVEEANMRATNPQMAQAIAERFFRDTYVLSDFQEAIVDELEVRYGFPELVAKTFYEMLCYLDATSNNDPLMDLYLKVVRGFLPPVHLHFMSYILFNLSFCWPTSNPSEEVSRDDATTVLQYLYRNSDKIIHVDVLQTVKEYEMATRNAPFTLISVRRFLSASILHQEEPLLLYLHGLFANYCDRDTEQTYENYEEVVTRFWQPRDEKQALLRFLMNGLGFNRGPTMNTRDLAYIAASSWCSSLWK